MAQHSKTPVRRTTKFAVMSLGSLCMVAAFSGLSVGTANADIKEVAPGPQVTSRQASTNGIIRINDFGVASSISAARLADAGEIEAEGSGSTEVRDTTKAVAGVKAKPFQGSYPVGPPLGDW